MVLVEVRDVQEVEARLEHPRLDVAIVGIWEPRRQEGRVEPRVDQHPNVVTTYDEAGVTEIVDRAPARRVDSAWHPHTCHPVEAIGRVAGPGRTRSTDVNDRGDRRDTLTVDDEQHVVPGRSAVGVRRTLDRQRAA